MTICNIKNSVVHIILYSKKNWQWNGRANKISKQKYSKTIAIKTLENFKKRTLTYPSISIFPLLCHIGLARYGMGYLISIWHTERIFICID